MEIQHTSSGSGGVNGPARSPQLRDALGRPYEPAVSPRLKVLLFYTFASVALLGASGAYLVANAAVRKSYLL